MSNIFLLDTNIVIAMFAQDDTVLSQIAVSEIRIPATVIGELYFGAEKSSRKTENRMRIDLLCEASIILSCTEATGPYYGRIKTSLRNNGTPIPDNDVWIAALALEHNLKLVSRDKHFEHVDSLTIEKW